MDRTVKTIRVAVPGAEYPLVVTTGGLDSLGAVLAAHLSARRVVVVTNPVVGELYLDDCVQSLERAGISVQTAEVPDGEVHKHLCTWRSLVETLLELRVDRSCAVIALGGGVTGDIAGFAASTLMRGVPLVQVPTTLLAMVDSAVGGKTGVNTAHGKNLVGAFHQPQLVFAPLSVLQTLPAEELRAGMAEVIKHGLLGDPVLWGLLEERGAAIVEGRDLAGLAECVLRSAHYKAGVVARDEREQGMRSLLNFGHTVGHAVEAVGAGRLRHGECVALGMRAEIRHGILTGRTLPDVAVRLEKLLTQVGLPLLAPKDLDRSAMVAAGAYDKKRSRDTIRVPAVADIGEAACIAVTLDEVAEMINLLDSTVPPGELFRWVEGSEMP